MLQALAIVGTSPDHRILTRIQPRDVYQPIPQPQPPIYCGLYLDLETTGVDTDTAEVIEFAGVRFTFDQFGTIYTTEDRYTALEQPSAPLDAKITDVTGLTDADLAGQKIDDHRVRQVMQGVNLVIAYNADFDRPIAERRFPGLFESVKWACAMRQVRWPDYGVVGLKFAHVLTAAGYFADDSHRAMADVRNGVHVLATMRREFDDDEPESEFGTWASFGGMHAFQSSPMLELLWTTKQGVYRVEAHDSPMEWKDAIKARGYQWRGRVPWYIDCPTIDAAKVELRWLRDTVACNPGLRRITARDRYSVRAE